MVQHKIPHDKHVNEPLSCATLDPERYHIYSGSDIPSMTMFDFENPEPLAKFFSLKSAVTTLETHPLDQKCYIGTNGGTIVQWDTHANKSG